MGVFGEVEIVATFDTEEIANKVAENLEEEVKKFIIKTNEKDFHLSYNEVDVDGSTIYVKLASGRVQNAEWQGQQTLDYMKSLGTLEEFSADVTTPENFLWWNKSEEE